MLLWGPRLEIENVLLEPVTGSHDRLSAFPSPPRPPPETGLKRDARRWSASARGMLEVVALLPRAILEESAVEMIVQPFVRIADAQSTLPTTAGPVDESP